MTDWFFYQERGKTVGPVTADDLRRRVREGVLRAFDLIYKEGESGWKMAMEHPDLREAFREAGQNVVKGRPWVCLRRKGENSLDFVTDGPFSDEEVRTALASGRLGYGDYVWRNEFAEWQRIGSLEVFNPRAKTPSVPPPKEPTREELLQNVVQLKRAPTSVSPTPEPAPTESDGEDVLAPRPRAKPRPPSEEETRVIMRRPLDDADDDNAEDEPSPPAPPPPPPSSLTNSKNSERSGITARTKKTVAPPSPAASEDEDAVEPTIFVPRKDIEGAAPPPRTGQIEVTLKRTRAPDPAPPAAPTPAPRAPRGEAPAMFVEGRVNRRSERSPWSDWFVVLALVAVLAVGIAVVLAKRHQAVPRAVPTAALAPASSAPAPAPVASAPPPLDASPPEDVAPPIDGDVTNLPAPDAALSTEPASPAEIEPPPPAAPPTPAPVATRAPTELRLSVTTSADGHARVDVRSNGSPDIPVFVQVVGLPGQVSDGPASYRFVRAASRGTLGKPVDLSNLEIPPGRYHITVDSGAHRRETTLNFGVGESRGRQALARQRKLGAGALWQERLRLYRVSQQVGEALRASGAGKKLSPRAFASLDLVGPATGAKYLFFDDWAELRTIVREGRTRVTADLLTRAQRARDRVATFSVYRPK